MARTDFDKPTKRARLLYSGGLCEAEGDWYGLAEGVRCNVSLAYGVHFDHFHADSNNGKATFENCRAVCPKCHRYKTDHIDTPRAAKTRRMSDKDMGIERPKKKIQSRGFRQQPSNTKYVNEGY